MFIQSLCLFFKLGYLCFCYWALVVIYTDYLIWQLFQKYFIPYCTFGFHYIDDILCNKNIFNLEEIQYMYFLNCFCF